MSADHACDETSGKMEYMKTLEEKGKLTSRVYYYLSLEDVDNLEKVKDMQNEFNTDKFKINGLKGFVDGTTSTRTAYMMEPYVDDPSTCGEMFPLVPRSIMEPQIVKANEAGYQVRLHCIGDAAVEMGLDMYEVSKYENESHDLSNTIEHS